MLSPHKLQKAFSECRLNPGKGQWACIVICNITWNGTFQFYMCTNNRPWLHLSFQCNRIDAMCQIVHGSDVHILHLNANSVADSVFGFHLPTKIKTKTERPMYNSIALLWWCNQNKSHTPTELYAVRRLFF